MSATDEHGRVQETFSAYLEGDLPAEARTNVDAHLGGCIQCRTALEDFRRTLGQLGGLRERAPNTFLPGIQKQIYQRSRGRFFARRWLLFGRIPFEWVSLAMIIAMLVYYIVSSMSSPTQVSPGL